MSLGSITSKIIRPIPVPKSGRAFLSWFGKAVSSPEQRLLIGGSAFFLQPFIDKRNKEVDQETSTLNACRSRTRAVVGTATGYAIRAFFIHGAKKYCNSGADKLMQKVGSESLNTLEKFFLSPGIKKLAQDAKALSGNAAQVARNEISERIGYYAKVLGTALALLTMTVTNFAIDVPLINKFSLMLHKWRYPEFYDKNQGGV